MFSGGSKGKLGKTGLTLHVFSKIIISNAGFEDAYAARGHIKDINLIAIFPSYRNQSIFFHRKPTTCFLHNGSIDLK